MRSLKYILTVGAGLFLVACNDSFMERYPQTSISEDNFFNTPQDLETYTNGCMRFYNIVQMMSIRITLVHTAVPMSGIIC